MTRTDDLTAALRSLDAAEHPVDPAGARAQADLQRILATEPRPARPVSPPCAPVVRPHGPGRTLRQLALVAGAVAAVTTGALTLPSLTGGDQAFASWTPQPLELTDQERAEAAADCQDAQEDGAGAEYAEGLRTTESVIAERRGVWTTVVLTGADGLSALCITDDSTGLFTRDMIGSVGTRPDHVAPGPRELVATDLGTGSMRAGDISLAAGAAGSEVAEVLYRSPKHGEVVATVSRGHFALWLPGDALADVGIDGVEVTVTYADGSTDASRLTL